MPNSLLIELKGGLGNQFFHYAFGMIVGLKTQRNIVFDASRYHTKDGIGVRNLEIHKFYNDINILYSPFQLLKEVGIYFPLVRWGVAINNIVYDKKRTSLFCKNSRILFAPDLLFDTIDKMCENLDNVIYIAKERFWGYEIFAPIKTLLQEKIHFQLPLNSHNTIAFQKIKNTKESVAVHIRRGDFLQRDYPIDLTQTQYYANAMQTMRKKLDSPTFFIFSDDKAFIRQHFQEKDCILMDKNLCDNVAFDFFLMQQCRHFIMANSTLSWWIAFLKNDDSIIITPKQWLNNGSCVSQDYIAPHYMRLDI